MAATEFTRRWLPDFAFDPTALIESGGLAKLQTLVGVEFDFVDTGIDHDAFTRDFFTRIAQHPVLVTVEHTSALRRPVRSYKKRSYELELDVGGGYTHLVGVVEVTDDRMAQFGNGRNAFIVFGQHELPITAETAQRALRCVPGLPGPACLDYAAVAVEFCDNASIVARMAGYGNTADDAALQFFATSDQERAIRVALSAARDKTRPS